MFIPFLVSLFSFPLSFLSFLSPISSCVSFCLRLLYLPSLSFSFNFLALYTLFLFFSHSCCPFPTTLSAYTSLFPFFLLFPCLPLRLLFLFFLSFPPSFVPYLPTPIFFSFSLAFLFSSLSIFFSSVSSLISSVFFYYLCFLLFPFFFPMC